MYSPYGPKRDAAPARMLRHDEVAALTQDDHPALSRNLLRELQAERLKQYEGLISAKNWDDFVDRRGQLRGVEASIALCQEAQRKLEA
jgi:hypothetical protein